MLSIQTFGTLRVALDSREIALPASRKTRALLGYLAISSTMQRRDRLCELFWDIPDDPRGALRWSLSKLRPVVNSAETTRLIADRERVQLDPALFETDFHRVREIANGNEASVDTLSGAWEQANALLMEDCELPNQQGFAAWLEQQRNEAVRLRVRLARRLAVHPPLAPEITERWAERWLMDAPFDPQAARHAVAARRKLGRAREASTLAEEISRRFVEAGLDPPPLSDAGLPAVDADGSGASTPAAPNAAKPRQVIRFVQARDKTSIAWAGVGRAQNPPLVKAANWLSHLELDWEAPVWSPLFREFAETFHFIRYDERGCGLSDWNVPDISFETFVSDLELVVEAAGVSHFPLLGISQGAAVSIEFAARHPDMVSHLILFGGYTAGWRHLASPDEVKEREAVMVLTETGWGRDNPSYRHIFSRTFIPDATAEELSWFDEFQRRTTSAANAIRFLEAFALIDVRERLKDVKCPTLVIHCRGDLRIPVSSGREMASQIPNAEFLSLDSNSHLLLGREPASAEFIEAVKRFVSS